MFTSRTFKYASIAAVLGASLAGISSAHANDGAAIIEHLTASIERNNESDCKDEAALKCLGITESACLAAKSDLLNTCTLPMLKKMASGNLDELADLESKMAQCAYDLAVDKHNIDPAKYERCVANDAYDDSDAIMELLRNR